MKLVSVLTLLTAALPAVGAYTYDYSVNPIPKDPANLQQTANPGNGATSTSIFGNVNYVGPLAGSTPNDYEIVSEFSVGSYQYGNDYHNLRQSSQNYIQVSFSTSNRIPPGRGQP